jgi:tetratricopeptide (TPR) repeat protein
MRRWRITLGTGVVLSLFVTACLPSTPEPTATRVPLNCEALTNLAWAELAGNPDAAIDYAQQCIDMFEDEADGQQKELEKLDEAPPLGTVSEEQKEEIFSHWALNGVGTCYFIKGQALAAQGRNDDAKEAYQAATTFSCARTWDPIDDSFWSPADAAAAELR